MTKASSTAMAFWFGNLKLQSTYRLTLFSGVFVDHCNLHKQRTSCTNSLFASRNIHEPYLWSWPHLSSPLFSRIFVWHYCLSAVIGTIRVLQLPFQKAIPYHDFLFKSSFKQGSSSWALKFFRLLAMICNLWHPSGVEMSWHFPDQRRPSKQVVPQLSQLLLIEGDG